MRNQWQQSLFLVICFVLGIAPGALAEGEPISRVQAQQVIRDILSLNEIEQPLTTAEGLLVQQPAPAPAPQPTPAPTTVPTPEVVQVTGVKANPTDQGVEVILQTTLGQQLPVVNRSADNSYIADIPNAQLRLPSGEAFVFRSQKPITGITEITVTNFDANTIRVTVTGEAGIPTVQLFDSPKEGLIFGIVSAAASTPPQQPPQTQPAPQGVEPGNETEPDEPAAEGEEEIEVVVTGEQDTGYSVPNTSVGTRTDTPLRDIPQSIQVVPQEVLRDQNVTRLEEALRSVTGVTPSSPTISRFSGFTIRGFRVGSSSGNFLRDGLRDPFGEDVPDLSNIERIEALKGPASVLFGLGSPGGTINLVTKQPLRDPFYAIDATIGNYDFYQGAIDLSGPLNDSRTVLYRLNAAYLDRRSFVDFSDNRRFFISPVVSLALGERTRLILEGDYTNSSTDFVFGLPAVGTVLPNPNGRIPRNRLTGEPDDSAITQTVGRVGYRLEHRFSENWSLQNAFRASFWRTDNGDRIFIPTSLAPDNRTLNGIFFPSESSIDAYNATLDIIGKFSTGSIDHQLVLGIDLSRRDNFKNRGRSASARPLDLFNPVYGQTLPPLTPNYDISELTDSLGIYVQDQITLTENLKLLLGGRFDLFEQTNRDFLADTETSQSGDAFSPRVGIVYQPIQPISLYASYSRSFTPAIGTAFDGSVFQPERGTQYEVGVKADLNDQLAITLALYELTRSGVLTDDPDQDDPIYSIQTGEQRSRGVELSVQGEILPGWNIITGYAYTDAQITKDNTFAVGNLLNNAPENSFNLWTSYEIQQGPWKGFGVGAGLFFVGERQGDLINSFQLPSYLRTDAAIFYKRDQFRVGLNFRNLFNVDYFETSFSRLRVFPGEPFTVQGTISWEF